MRVLQLLQSSAVSAGIGIFEEDHLHLFRVKVRCEQDVGAIRVKPVGWGSVQAEGEAVRLPVPRNGPNDCAIHKLKNVVVKLRIIGERPRIWIAGKIGGHRGHGRRARPLPTRIRLIIMGKKRRNLRKLIAAHLLRPVRESQGDDYNLGSLPWVTDGC